MGQDVRFVSVVSARSDANLNQAFLGLGGRFTLSDDSHQVEHVGTNYARLAGFLERVGIREVFFLQAGEAGPDARFPGIALARVETAELSAQLAKQAA